MGFRWQIALGTVASLLVIASCGGGGSGSANPTASKPSIPTVSLPLQSSGLAVGGDVQSRASDVLKRGITREQAQSIADACDHAAEIANGPQTCAQEILRVLKSSQLCDNSEFCLNVSDVSTMKKLGYDGYIEIVDNQPEKPLCEAQPNNVCLRVGVATTALLNQIVASAPPSTSSEVTTSTEATTSTETTPTTVSDTSSSTPEATSAPTATS
jgi:hypothetical protein